MAKRQLRNEERILIEALLKQSGAKQSYVIPEEAGSLGEAGLQLSTRGDHAEDLAEATYVDEDRREVYITLTSNEHGELFELDIWKSDFSPLRRYPAPADLRFD